MAECWICIQKAQYKLQKINAARAEAKLQSNELEQTMAVIKKGVRYEVIEISKLNGESVVEFISGNK